VINHGGRASELGGIANLADEDDGPVYHALSVHLSRAKLITRFDDRQAYAVATFSKSRVWSKVSEGILLFLKVPEFL